MEHGNRSYGNRKTGRWNLNRISGFREKSAVLYSSFCRELIFGSIGPGFGVGAGSVGSRWGHRRSQGAWGGGRAGVVQFVWQELAMCGTEVISSFWQNRTRRAPCPLRLARVFTSFCQKTLIRCRCFSSGPGLRLGFLLHAASHSPFHLHHDCAAGGLDCPRGLPCQDDHFAGTSGEGAAGQRTPGGATTTRTG